MGLPDSKVSKVAPDVFAVKILATKGDVRLSWKLMRGAVWDFL